MRDTNRPYERENFSVSDYHSRLARKMILAGMSVALVSSFTQKPITYYINHYFSGCHSYESSVPLDNSRKESKLWDISED